MAEQLVDEKELACILAQSPRTLQAQRLRGGGIPYIKIGRSVRYDLQDVNQFLAAQRRASSSEPRHDDAT
ncbi:MAG: DNA-binding protein [Cytophagaceae bacterium]|nr:MAG: DNA-binding protein [Cytophagaceae bacterium]